MSPDSYSTSRRRVLDSHGKRPIISNPIQQIPTPPPQYTSRGDDHSLSTAQRSQLANLQATRRHLTSAFYDDHEDQFTAMPLGRGDTGRMEQGIGRGAHVPLDQQDEHGEDLSEAERTRGGVLDNVIQMYYDYRGHHDDVQPSSDPIPYSVDSSRMDAEESDLPVASGLSRRPPLTQRASSMASNATQGLDDEDPRISGLEKNDVDEKAAQEIREREKYGFYGGDKKIDYKALELTPEQGEEKARITRQLKSIISKQRFVLRLAKALMLYGAPSHRLESQLIATSRILAVPVQVIIWPGVALISFTDKASRTSETHIVKVTTRLMLGKLHAVHEIYRSVMHSQIGVEEGTLRLSNLLKSPSAYSKVARCFFAFCCAFVICVQAFGGSVIDAAVAGCAGFLLAYLQLFAAPKSSAFRNVFEISTALWISFLARGLSSWQGDYFCYSAIQSAGVVLILPGFAILTSALDLVSRNVISGSARLTWAIAYTLFLGFSLTAGSDLWYVIDSTARNQRRLAAESLTSIVNYNGTFAPDPNNTDVFDTLKEQLNVSFDGAWQFVNRTSNVSTQYHYQIVGCYRESDWEWWRQPFPAWTLFLLVPLYSLCSSSWNLQPFRSKQLPVMIGISSTSYLARKVLQYFIGPRQEIVSAIGAFVIGLAATGGLSMNYHGKDIDQYQQTIQIGSPCTIMVRTKHVLEALSIPARLKLVYSRVTASRLAVFYLLLASTHCIVQVGLQITALSFNTNAADLLNDIINVAGLQSNNFTLYNSNTKTLESCSGHGSSLACITIWQATADAVAYSLAGDLSNSSALSASTTSSSTSTTFPATAAVSQISTPTSTESNGAGAETLLNATPTVTQSNPLTTTPVSSTSVSATSTIKTGEPLVVTHTVFVDTTVTVATPLPTAVIRRRQVYAPQAWIQLVPGSSNSSVPTLDKTPNVQVAGLADNPGVVDLPLSCVAVMRWPLQTLRNTQREDVVFVIFQIWVLGMSLVAVLNESIPHTVAALLTHGMATMWSAFQLVETSRFKESFATLTVNGACRGIKLFPTYWNHRAAIELSILVLNSVVLVAIAFASWKVIKVFGWATFRRVGASREVNNIYRVVLVMAIMLQLSLFFILASVALWIDQLHSGAIGKFSSHGTIEMVVMSVIICLLVPWLALGWYSVRKENKKMMYAFLVISIILVGEWASEFISSSWRLTFSTWAFFALMSSVSMSLTLVVTVLGVCCLRNFGHGLPYSLKDQEPIESDDFERISPPTPDQDLEKLSSTTLEELIKEGDAWAEEEIERRDVMSWDRTAAVSLPAALPIAHISSFKAAVGHPIPRRSHSHQKSSLGSLGITSEKGVKGVDWFDEAQSKRSRWSQESDAQKSESKLLVIKRWAIQ
ncbi:hypothetical protein FRB97_000818 [Tulasnella sp. 331]|nr:hypothetical protein FRB97_000818 [Tulasnella sp. 331]